MVRRAISNLGRVLTRKQTEIMGVATMIMGLGFVTKIFGLFSTQIASGYLSTDAWDKFLFASNLPELISQVILVGGLGATVLPILSQTLTKDGPKRFIRVFNTVVNLSLLGFVIIAIIITIAAPTFIPWFIENVIRPREAISAADMVEIVDMTRVLMLPQIVLGISIYVTMALNVYDRFLITQLAPLFYNFGRLVSLYIFLPLLGQTPWVLVLGTILGSILHLLIQIPIARHIGLRYRLDFDLKDAYVKTVVRVASPRLLAVSIEQISVAIDRFIAFSLAGNAQALYYFAVLLISIPLSLIGSSYATASYPTLSRAFNEDNRILAGQVFLRILNQIIFLSIPLAVLLFILRVPIVRLTYGILGSEIDFLKTYTIAWVVLFFAPGIVLESTRMFLYRTFYAAHDTFRPLIISVFVLIGGYVTGVLFTNYFSHFNSFAINEFYFNLDYFFKRSDGVAAVGGLGLSSSLVFSLEAVILIVWLNKKYLKLPVIEIVIPILKKVFAGTVMLLFTYLVFKIWGGLESTERTLYLLILTFTTSAAAMAIYIGISGLLRIGEVKTYLRLLAKYPNLNQIRRLLKFNPISTGT